MHNNDHNINKIGIESREYLNVIICFSDNLNIQNDYLMQALPLQGCIQLSTVRDSFI